MTNQPLKTGTTTLGIVCKDGVVIAADKRITAGNMIVSQKSFQKANIINKDLAITMAGVVSDAQLLMRLIKAQIRIDELRRNKSLKVKEASHLLANLVYNNIRKMSVVQGITSFLLGGKDSTGFYLFDIGMDGSLIEYNTYASTGSGSPFAMGVLESGFKPNMTINEGITLAQKALSAAMQRDSASGGGIDVITVTKQGTEHKFTKLVDDKLKI